MIASTLDVRFSPVMSLYRTGCGNVRRTPSPSLKVVQCPKVIGIHGYPRAGLHVPRCSQCRTAASSGESFDVEVEKHCMGKNEA
jgi:hypothetical protein